jgi:phosphatidylserine/phosphatidylglycerophosphate/cardiolipin synthase-like enzyme
MARVDVVATTPADGPLVLRTRESLRRMVTHATQEVVVVGYSVTDPDVITMLADSKRKGVQISFFLDPKQGGAESIDQHWPVDVEPPEIWIYTAESDGSTASLHAKVVIVDGNMALVSSANFTFSGMHRNTELGLLAEGRPARELRDFVRALVAKKLFEPRQ